MPLFDIWNNSQVFLGKSIALTFGDLYYLDTALNKMKEFSPHNQTILKKMITLWMLKVYRYDEFVDSEHHPLIEDLMAKICKELTPECLGIMECVAPDDSVIGSPFACTKGQGF